MTKTEAIKLLKEDQERIVGIVENWSKEHPEELDKKYIIEISMIVDKGLYRIKGTDCWLSKEELEQLEEYAENEG